MRIVVFGAGAVGSALGGLLAQAGHSVALLGRAEHMSAVRGGGLLIEGIWGVHRITNLECARTPDELIGRPFDLVLLTVKSYDTHDAIESILRLNHAGLSLVSVQNGYGNTQALQSAFGSDRVFGARIITGVELPEPGRVVVTVSADDIRLGPPAGENDLMPRAREIAEMMRSAGIPTSETDRYREFLWAKILYNCALNPLGALLRATYGELASQPGTRSLIEAIITEAFGVAQAQQIPLFWSTAEQYCRHFFDELIPPTARHYPSMLRDLERHARTEIAALNGAVVRLATQSNISVPINQALTGMIQLREQTRQAELKRTP